MKKYVSFILMSAFILGAFSGCGGKKDSLVDDIVLDANSSTVVATTVETQQNEEDSNTAETCVVPDLTGMTTNEAFEALAKVGLEGQVEFNNEEEDKDNPVSCQNVQPGETLNKGELVCFYIGTDENHYEQLVENSNTVITIDSQEDAENFDCSMYGGAIVRFVGAVVSVGDAGIYLEFGDIGIHVMETENLGLRSCDGETVDCTGQVKTVESESAGASYTEYFIEIQKIG